MKITAISGLSFVELQNPDGLDVERAELVYEDCRVPGREERITLEIAAGSHDYYVYDLLKRRAYPFKWKVKFKINGRLFETPVHSMPRGQYLRCMAYTLKRTYDEDAIYGWWRGDAYKGSSLHGKMGTDIEMGLISFDVWRACHSIASTSDENDLHASVRLLTRFIEVDFWGEPPSSFDFVLSGSGGTAHASLTEELGSGEPVRIDVSEDGLGVQTVAFKWIKSGQTVKRETAMSHKKCLLWGHACFDFLEGGLCVFREILLP